MGSWLRCYAAGFFKWSRRFYFTDGCWINKRWQCDFEMREWNLAVAIIELLLMAVRVSRDALSGEVMFHLELVFWTVGCGR
jgi:hypothetical protein